MVQGCRLTEFVYLEGDYQSIKKKKKRGEGKEKNKEKVRLCLLWAGTTWLRHAFR
jgi:hypothetical protein